jgi:SAM-dependent methyltransferase
VLVDLGTMPLANAFVRLEQAGRPEPVYPLRVQVCEVCYLVQVDETVPPDAIFRDYAYFSSYSASWVEHARRFVEAAIARLELGPRSLVAEVASNDGYLLQHFVAKGLPVIGIDPAVDAAAAARTRGVPTETLFFGRDTALDLRRRHGPADLIVANNVLAHVPDLNDFVAGFAVLLADRGVASFEFPHLVNLLEQVQFDTIYHEHFSYLSLHAVEVCLARHGLRVFDVETLPTHGGSLRLWTVHAGDPRPDGNGLAVVRTREKDLGIATPTPYEGFADKVGAIRDGLLAFLARARAAGRRTAAYGAAAKGNTLLNFCGVTADDIAFVVDANPHKQGTLLPGSRIPVRAPAALREARPDYVLILPWNLMDEIITAAAFVREWGGRFVVAVPRLSILP